MNNKNVWVNILFLIASNFNFLKYNHTIIVNVQHTYYLDRKHFSLVFKSAFPVTADFSRLYLPTDQVYNKIMVNQ